MARTDWKLPKGATWRQKLEREHPNHGRIVPVPPRMQKRFGTGTMVIPRPLDVDAVMRKVRKGKLITASQIGVAVVAQTEADCACPMTTGIFIRIAAEAAEEDRRAGKKRITPYWRTVKADGSLNERFPGGAKAQAAKLRAEGFAIEPRKGTRPPKVREFERFLAKL